MANFYKKSHQSGRSMIEMLGVLAIIGMLSLGSISAYSAAMFKHQLNQHMESFSLLLNNAITLLPEMRRNYGKGIGNVSKLFADTSLLPAGMHYSNNAILDVFKNSLYISYYHIRNGNRDSSEYLMQINIDRDNDKISSRARAICRNVMMAAKENAANIWAVQMRSGSQAPDGGYSGTTLTGGTYNSGGRTKRLADASLTDLDEVCASCNSQRYCVIVLYIDVTFNK